MNMPLTASLIGKPLRRVEARAKVTGRADYAADRLPSGGAHAALVTAAVAKGRITRIDTAAARAVPGVLLVATHEERRPAIHRVVLEMELTFGRRAHEDMPPLQGAEIHYAGQAVAMVVAETPEAAGYAASLVDVAYEAEKPLTIFNFDAALPGAIRIGKVKGAELDETHGDPATELAGSSIQVDGTYTTPPEHHCAIELYARVAEWRGDELLFHEPSQWVAGNGRALAQALGVPDDKVHLVNPFVGGGFGGKAYFRYDSALCAWAARELCRPVKLVLSREQAFILGGARPLTRQRVALGADATGRLRAVVHESWTASSFVDRNYQETCGYQTRVLYATPAIRTTHRMVPFDIGSTCPMRGPGIAPGSFAIESAMDELACELGVDPLELRLRNHSDRVPGTGREFSPKHLRDCYATAAERIGWASRTPGGHRDGDWLVGMGMATASYDVVQLKARATVALLDDGTALVSTAANDLGTGTYTVLSQVAADGLRLPMDRICCELGDNRLPAAGAAAGQSQANSTGPAVADAADAVVRTLVRLASGDPASPLANLSDDRMAFADGRLFAADDPDRGERFEDLLRRQGLSHLAEESMFMPLTATTRHSLQSWGAQFVEVGVRRSSGEVRVRRVASAFDFGRVLNERTARAQLTGGIVFGIGMALLENGEYDPRTGRMVNASLGEYLVPVQADVPQIEVVMLDRPDLVASPVLGAKGCGEIGTVGVAAAIANAVFNATGVRVRDLPILPEKILLNRTGTRAASP